MEPKIEYLTEKQVSEMTKLALPTLRNYRHQGKGPPYLKIGRSVRYSMADLLEFMERGRVRVQSDS
jgi:predicted DNA-binding transcriptional regulator AlpA